jgi:hypothetical protein
VAFAWSGFTRGRLIYSIYDPGHTWQLYLKLKENIDAVKNLRIILII